MQYLYDKITAGMKPLKMAIVHPKNGPSIEAAWKAANANLIVPILVGPEDGIKKAADAAGVDITSFEIVPTKYSELSAQKAVELVAAGEAEALMKGSLHTSEFLKAVLNEKSLRTKYKMSHVFVLTDPGYHKPLFLTDTAFNVEQSLLTKADITQNAIHLFWTVEGHAPKVAVVTATEEVDIKQPETIDASSLTGMNNRMQITGGKVDGPLGFDMAIDKEAAKEKGIVTDITGDPDIIVFPNLSAGNIFFKSRLWMRPRHPDGTFMYPTPDIAGIVLGASKPIILTSRSASVKERYDSIVLGVINARSPHRTPS